MEGAGLLLQPLTKSPGLAERFPAAVELSKPTLFPSHSSSKRCQCCKHCQTASPAPFAAIPKLKAFSLLRTRGGSCPPAPEGASKCGEVQAGHSWASPSFMNMCKRRRKAEQRCPHPGMLLQHRHRELKQCLASCRMF